MNAPSQLRRLAAVALLCSVPCYALPDTPTPKLPTPATTEPSFYIAGAPKPLARGDRAFWTRSTKIEAGALAGVAAFDAAQTCHNLATGGREYWLNTRTCGGAVAIMAAWDLGTVGAAWLLHRTHHDRLARLPMLYEIQAHTRGIIYSRRHHAW
jgi:hypothetical protein